MIQFQTALVYFMTAWWKATGETWVNGTALYYVQHLQEFHRFPMPSWTNNPLIIKVQTWFGLAEEFALGTLIWIVEVRYWVLAAGVVLHLALEYSMNVPLFQWIMMSTFVLFVDPADLYSFWTFICQRVVTSEIQLIYDATDFDARRKVNIIRSLDIFRKISFLVERSGSWCVTRPEGNVYGVEALGELATVIPVLWVLRPFFRNKKRRKCVSSTGTAK
jgi:hypothetical protein